MNRTQFQEILATYERDRTKNRHILEERRRQVLALIPEYGEIEQSIASYAAGRVRQMLSDEAADPQAGCGRDEIAAKRDKLNALLRTHSLPENYLMPIYTCPDCRDTGYIDGRQKCHCLRQKIAASLYENSGLKELLSTENFDHLDRSLFSGEDLMQFEKNYRKATDFIQNFGSDFRNLYFYGTVGTGKSFLSCCIAKELMDKEYQVVYYSANQLFDRFQTLRFTQDALKELEDIIFQCDLLILDDLATEAPGDYVKSKLFSLLNDRYVTRRATIISSNVSLNELDAHYSERIFSRIVSHYDLLKFTGPDLRILKKRAVNRK